MINKYNASIGTEEKPKRIVDLPSEEEQLVVRRIFEKFRNTADNRNRNFENFDGDNLIDYISDSMDRYITNVYDREYAEDWQARVHNPFTRNKVIAILGKIVKTLPIASFKTRGEDDPQKGRILTDMYQYSEDLDDYEVFIINFLQEAIIKGTAVGYEGQRFETRKNRRNGKDAKIVKNELFAKIVRLEDFYPSSVGIESTKKMPHCFWRDVITYEEFTAEYEGVTNFDRVKANQTELESEDRPFYLDYISSNVGDGMVEIVRYYSVLADEYIVLANGIWINPREDDTVEYMPFEHGELPFWDIKFESFGSQFFYGKSLPDKLKSFQDVLDVLNNMLIDQSILTIFPPMLTNGFDDMEDDYLRPGRRTPIDTQGTPIKDAYAVLDMGTPSSWHQFILNYTEKVMEQSSVDQVSSGQAGVGDRTTAAEIRTAAEGVESMLGLFDRLVKNGIKRKALLRAGNILQFWTKADSPVTYKSFEKQGGPFNVFKVEDSKMTGGKRGRKVIELHNTKRTMPTKEELQLRQEIFETESDQRIEIIAIPAKYIKNLEFEVETVANRKTENTKEATQALQLEKTRVYMSFFPDKVDTEYLMSELAEVFGDDPTKVIKQQEPAPQVQGAAGATADGGVGTIPQGNVANNVMRSAKGGENIPANI